MMVLVFLAGASPEPTSPTHTCSGVATCLFNGVSDAVNSAAGVIDFWSDPWGNTFKALQASARELAGSVLPTVTRATLPDLSAGWFVKAYAVTFALAIFLATALLLPQIVRAARGALSTRELFDSIGIYLPLFLIGSMFGPPFGVILVRFFGSLSDAIIGWGVTSTAGTVTDRFRAMLSAQDASGIAGGAPVADLLILLMLLGLLLVVVMLIVQLVTLYFTGVLLPLGLVWVIDPARRRFGTRIVSLWIGLLAAHPLLYLLLSVAYLMVGGNIDAFGANSTLQKTVTLIVALLALFIAGLSPVALMRLAPVMLSGAGTAGSGVAMPAIGLRSIAEADDRYSPEPVATAPSGGSVPPGPPAPPSVDTVSDRAAAAGGGTSETESTTVRHSGGTSALEQGSPATVTAPGPAPAVVGANSGAATTVRAGAGSSAAAAATEGGVVAAGAGETATGVGAPIGVPTMLLGIGLAGVRGAKQVGNDVIDKAAAPVESGERVGSDRLHE